MFFKFKSDGRTGRGWAEECGNISVGDYLVGIGNTYANTSLLSMSAEAIETLIQHHTKPVTICFMSPARNAANRAFDVPLKSDQLFLLAASIQRDIKIDITQFESSFKNVLALYLSKDVCVQGLEIFYTNLITDLQPYIGEGSVSMISLDPSIFNLYQQIKNLHDLMKSNKVVVSYLDIEYFFGRHVPTWIELTYNKVSSELIPNILKQDGYIPISEDMRHSEGCVSLFWICIQNANLFKTLPRHKSTGFIGRFALRLLAGPLRVYVDNVKNEFVDRISESTKAEEKGFISRLFGKKTAFETKSLEVTIELCVMMNNIFHCQKQLYVILAALNDIKESAVTEGASNAIDVSKYNSTADVALAAAHKDGEGESKGDADNIEDILTFHWNVTIKGATGSNTKHILSPKVIASEYCVNIRLAQSQKELTEGLLKVISTPYAEGFSPQWNFTPPRDFGEIVHDEPQVIFEIQEREKFSGKLAIVGSVTLSLRRYLDGGENDIEFDIIPVQKAGNPPTRGQESKFQKLNVKFSFNSVEVGMNTFLHLKTTLSQSVDKLVRSMYLSGVIMPLTDFIFGEPIKDTSSVNPDITAERMEPLLDYLTDQLTVLNQIMYSDIFVPLVISQLWTIMCEEICEILIVHSSINTKASTAKKSAKKVSGIYYVYSIS